MLITDKGRVFLCHSSGDKEAIRALYTRLRDEGLDPWLDEEDLLAGQIWDTEIKKAVRRSDIVLVCLSKSAVTRSGYVQREIEFALNIADEKPDGTIYIVPAKLEDCVLPERLRKWHAVDLFKPGGFERLVRAIKHKTEGRR